MTDKPYAVFLSDVSPNDEHWDVQKGDNIQLARLYYGTEHESYTSRLFSCAEFLSFGLNPSDIGLCKLILKDAKFCRVPLCPICLGRRSMKWQAKTFKILPKLIEENPKSRFVLLTLTVRNCHISDLRSTITEMQHAWRKLTQRKEWRYVQGYIRSLEVTRQCLNNHKSNMTDYAHPHYHVLLMVKPSYFTTGYVKHEDWVKVWQDCLGVDYSPVISLSAVKTPKNASADEIVKILSKNVLEVVKYTTKSSDLILHNDNLQTMTNKQWLVELTNQLHKVKKIFPGGIFKDYYKEFEDNIDDNLINIDDELEEEESEDSSRVIVNWDKSSGKYEVK
jgi:plasmid rolling circle replication initiator protein Rep